MKKKMICLSVLGLSILSSTTFAANWQYIGESTNSYGNYYAYVDKDTVVKNGDVITFWEMTRYYKLNNNHGKPSSKWIQKSKLLTQSQEYIILENNSYDAKDKEVFHQKYGEKGLGPTPVKEAPPILKQEIDFVLQNAKNGVDIDERPNPSYKDSK